MKILDVLLYIGIYLPLILGKKRQSKWKNCYKNFANNGTLDPSGYVCIDGLGPIHHKIFDNTDHVPVRYPQAKINKIDIIKYIELTMIKFKNPTDKDKICQQTEIFTKTAFDDKMYLQLETRNLLQYCNQNFVTRTVKIGYKNYSPNFKIQNFTALKEFGFSSHKKSIFFTHGFTPSWSNPAAAVEDMNFFDANKSICDKNGEKKIKALVRPGMWANCLPEEHNVFMLNWSALSTTPYDFAVNNTVAVGRYMANFLINLAIESRKDATMPDLDFQKIHLVGFSLGAHIMGMTGKRVHLKSKQDVNNHAKYLKNKRIPKWSYFKEFTKVGKITGLDPASFAFTSYLPDDTQRQYSSEEFNKKLNESKVDDVMSNFRLEKTDAQQTVAIHTDTFGAAGGFGAGTYLQSGHIDVYVNNGTDQPRCVAEKNEKTFFQSISDGISVIVNSLQKTVCDHESALNFFSQVIRRKSLNLRPITAYQVPDLPEDKKCIINSKLITLISERYHKVHKFRGGRLAVIFYSA